MAVNCYAAMPATILLMAATDQTLRITAIMPAATASEGRAVSLALATKTTTADGLELPLFWFQAPLPHVP